ncbi:MAG: NAD(P)H-dependent glycerol-3-phosphate dehydrogenase [Elusimicrobiota bacterium]
MKNPNKSNKICVLGGGLWGTALADHIARKRLPVTIWEYFPELARKLQKTRRHPHIPRYRLRPQIRVTSDLGMAVRGAGVILTVLPSAFVRQTARNLRPLLEGAPRPILINASKGVEPDSLRTMGEVLLEEIPFLAGCVFTVSGPSFALEVIRGVPTKLVLAGAAGARAKAAARILNGDAIRVEHSTDRIGVELGGSLKNVLAVGCGIAEGLGDGANTQAALMVQGIHEMGMLIERFGGRRETIFGLSGIGDLIATGSSFESRNRTLGYKLGRRKGLKRALKEIPTVAEGVESSKSAHTLVKAGRLKAPLLEAIYRVIHREGAPELVIQALGFERSGK